MLYDSFSFLEINISSNLLQFIFAVRERTRGGEPMGLSEFSESRDFSQRTLQSKPFNAYF
jgi:hypothetical protein